MGVGENYFIRGNLGAIVEPMKKYLVRPEPNNPALTQRVDGVDHANNAINTLVPVECPLTLFLNSQEIVTVMTIGDFPEDLALGFLLNQNMLTGEDIVTAVEHEPDINVVVVRTERETDFEDKLSKKTRTSGCAQGTAFGDVMEKFESVVLPDAPLKTSWLYALSKAINTTPSLYLEAGAIHGCVLCERDKPLVYMEDVGRHNAVDKVAGYMYRTGLSAINKIMYTTGRLTSEMIIKTVQMEIPILVSRSGFTAWGVELARQANLTLIGRTKGKRFVALSGSHRIEYDADPEIVPSEAGHIQRKGSRKPDAD